MVNERDDLGLCVKGTALGRSGLVRSVPVEHIEVMECDARPRHTTPRHCRTQKESV